MEPDLDALAQRSDELWEESILPSLMDFAAIPALSPGFDPNWADTGDPDPTVYLFCGCPHPPSLPRFFSRVPPLP